MAEKVKIRVISDWSIIATGFLAALCLAISIFGYGQYKILRSAMQDYMTCEQAAQKLQDGSDVLTKQVRLAAATGEQAYIDAYFEEANVTRTREKAVEEIASLDSSVKAFAALQEALSVSTELMQTEYYAMRLIEESMDAPLSVWPEALQAVQLSQEDAALSPEGKLHRAQSLVIGPAYETAKDMIASDVRAAVSAISESINNRQDRAASIFTDAFRKIILCMLIFAVMMLLICLMMRHWVVHPLLDYNDSIRQGGKLPVYGANELQMLAKTYNELYEENQERQKLMKHQAEHDPLTGLLNRGSFDRILDLYEKDGSHFALILIDVDTFKSVNDTYGHAVGDAILRRVANLLKTAFRNIDYVCRIGGDEFAIIMVDMTSSLSYTITGKIEEINRQLAAGQDGLPAVSLSVGAAFTDRPNPGRSLFTDADSALYFTKEHGRRGCTFYPAGEEREA